MTALLSPAQLDGYLARIRYDGPLRPDLETLRAVHRAHALAIPYEVVDIQLGRPISLDAADVYAKLVVAGRGGYCYEQNGLLIRALRAIGLTVSIVEGAEGRTDLSGGNWRNHMLGVVDVDGSRFLADVGLGDAFLEPLPLAEGVYDDVSLPGLACRVEPLADGTWRVLQDPLCSVDSFDVRPTPLTFADFAAKNEHQSTSPESPYVRKLVIQRTGAEHYSTLRARTMTLAGPGIPGGRERWTIGGEREFGEILSGEFGLRLDDEDVTRLWKATHAQHEEWLAARGDDVAAGPAESGSGSDRRRPARENDAPAG